MHWMQSKTEGDIRIMEKKDLLIKLQKQEQIHVILSKCTRLPHVHCDAETYDDEIFVFFDEKDAAAKAEKFTEAGELVVVVPIPNKNFLPFYSGLFPMGVNAIVVDGDTENETCIQLEELVRKPDDSKLPKGQVRIENQSLHLTGMYFMQELRKKMRTELDENLLEMQQEMLSHFSTGTYVVALKSDQKGVVLMKNPQGQTALPIFTDIQEFQKFQMSSPQEKFLPGIVQADKVGGMLPPEASTVILNPMGINVPLNVAKKNK